jgi:hypothetical protein
MQTPHITVDAAVKLMHGALEAFDKGSDELVAHYLET